MHVLATNMNGNPNIGLYAFTTDTYCILGPEAECLKEHIEQVLDVPVILTTIAGTSLVGVFCAGNTKTLLVPEIIQERELKALESADIDVHIIKTTHTALANNVVVNDHGCLAGPMFTKGECDNIERALKLPVKQFLLADVEVVGASVVHTTKGALVHKDASQFEQDMLVDTLRIPHATPGTVNFGNPFVKSGVIANTKGFLIGSSSGGPEIQNTDEALGFIEG